MRAVRVNSGTILRHRRRALAGIRGLEVDGGVGHSLADNDPQIGSTVIDRFFPSAADFQGLRAGYIAFRQSASMKSFAV